MEYTAIDRRRIETFQHPYFKPAQILRAAAMVNTTVLVRLKRTLGLEILNELIDEVQHQLESGMLIHPREAEVVLLRKSKASYRFH